MNALPILYRAYCKLYPELGGNINEHGKLNLARLEKYFEVLAENEFDMFQDHHADLTYFQAKQSNGVDEAFDFDVNEIKDNTESNTESDLAKMIQDSEMVSFIKILKLISVIFYWKTTITKQPSQNHYIKYVKESPIYFRTGIHTKLINKFILNNNTRKLL